LQEDIEEWKKVRPGSIRIVASTLEEDRWIISFDSPNRPPATYLYSRKQRKAELLFESLPWLKGEELSEMQPIQYKSRDGLLIHGYLTIPAGSGGSGLPTVLLVHGGPWERDKWEFQSVVQLLAIAVTQFCKSTTGVRRDSEKDLLLQRGRNLPTPCTTISLMAFGGQSIAESQIQVKLESWEFRTVVTQRL
jgi:hypothetical protein